MGRILFGGIDLGGTKTLSLVVGSDGSVVGEDRRPSRALEGPEAVIPSMVDSLIAAAGRAGASLERLGGVGVASPGPIDAVRGVVTTPPNFARWRDIPLAEEISSRLGLATYLDNDANCAALGELHFGAARGAREVIYITLGTGFGGAIITGGSLYRGATGGAGELGHMVVAAHGLRCFCGNDGCIEAYCSGRALGLRGQELVDHGLSPLLVRLAAGAPVEARVVFAAARGGDEASLGLIAEAARYLGAALSSFVNIFNPELIVIGGSLATDWDLLIEPAVMEMRRRAFPSSLRAVRMVPGLLGLRAGALGAATLAMTAPERPETGRGSTR